MLSLNSDNSKVVLDNEVGKFLISDLSVMIQVILRSSIEKLALSCTEDCSESVFSFTSRKLEVVVSVKSVKIGIDSCPDLFGQFIAFKFELVVVD